MTEKNTQLFAMIEDYKLELEKQLAEELKTKELSEKRIGEIRAEIAELPVRPPKQRKAKTQARKAKKSPGRVLAGKVIEEAQSEERADDQ